MKVGLIRVLTTDNKDILLSHERIIRNKFNLDIETKCIKDQFDGINSKKLFDEAVIKIIELAEEFKDKDIITISCADDPALEELKELYPNKTIIGAGKSTLSLALNYSNKIGVLGITDYLPRAYIPYKDNIVLARPKGVRSTLDLINNKESAIEEAIKLREKGVGVIALACTGFSTIGLVKTLEANAKIPVIDPVIAQGIFAYFETIR